MILFILISTIEKKVTFTSSMTPNIANKIRNSIHDI